MNNLFKKESTKNVQFVMDQITVKAKMTPRTGSKKELAWELINDMRGQPVSRIVDVLVEQLGVTKQNAKVYMWHYNQNH